MLRKSLLVLIPLATCLAVACAQRDKADDALVEAPRAPRPQSITPPPPDTVGTMTLETALATRRSVRNFAPSPLSDVQIGQLCWACQGVTGADGVHRTSPSAGALYPLELYVATPDHLLHYLASEHRLEVVQGGDLRPDLQAAALDQEHIGQAPAVFIVCGVVERLAVKYGDRSERFMFIESGHAAQNLLLQAVAQGLGACPVGAFDDQALAQLLGLGPGEVPLYLIPAGSVAAAAAAP